MSVQSKARRRRYTKMHVGPLRELADEYDKHPTRENCQQLVQYIKRHALTTAFPLWFRMSELCSAHQLQPLYISTFQSPVFTLDEYKVLTSLLLNKGCTLQCIHGIYMYMFNPSACFSAYSGAGSSAMRTTLDATVAV